MKKPALRYLFLWKLQYFHIYKIFYGGTGFPCGSVGKESACSAGDLGLTPGSERSPGKGNGNPLQYSYLEILQTEEPGGLPSMGL